MIAVYISFCENNKDIMHKEAASIRDSVLKSLFPTYSSEKITVVNEGKPVLKDFPVYFSTSHSSGGVAFAVSGNFSPPPQADNAYLFEISDHATDIGVDIEALSRKINFSSVMKDIFSPSEISYVGESKEKFIEIFTKKESLCKLSGNGLRDLMNFDTFNLPENIFTTTFRMDNEEDGFCISISYKK